MRVLIFSACCFSVLLPVPALTQTLSPLQQVMTSMPLIARPAVFREMQAQLGKELKNVKPGLRVDALFSKFNELETMIQVPLTENKVEYNKSTHHITISLPHLRPEPIADFEYDPKKLVSNVTSEINDKLQSALQTMLKPIIISGFDRLSPSVRKSLFTSAIDYLSTHGIDELSDYSYDGANSSTVADKLAGVLSRFIIDRIQEYLLNQIRDKLPGIFKPVPEVLHPKIDDKTTVADTLGLYDKLAATDSAKASNGSAVTQKLDGDTVAAAISAGISKVQELLGHALGQAEELVQSAVKDGSRILVAGDVGLAVSDATSGSLSGGVVVSFLINSMIRGAVYANQSYVTDNSSPGSALYGLQLRIAPCNYFEIDGLFGYFGNRNIAYGPASFLSPDNGEYAVGGTFNLWGLLLTAGYSKMWSDGSDRSFSFAFQYPSISTSVITVGGAHDRLHPDWKPVFKISTPIIP